jgi:hypothetical protein
MHSMIEEIAEVNCGKIMGQVVRKWPERFDPQIRKS